MGIEKVFIVTSKDSCVYKNMALEEYLLSRIPPKSQILYLWQNDNAIVMGQNQNPYAQCNIQNVKRYSVDVARRISGGGAVYHDMGNLNFTFISPKEEYCVERNMQIIISSMYAAGICAKRSGRNDILVDGKKVSGNAFYEKGGHCCHHGTILIHTDLKRMWDLLSVDREKWKSKGIDSAPSRVGNLISWNSSLSVKYMMEELEKCFLERYSGAMLCSEIAIEEECLGELKKKYESFDWIWGKKIPGNLFLNKRFIWGDVTLAAEMDGNTVKEIQIFTDALEADFFHLLQEKLKGVNCHNSNLEKIRKDICKGSNQIIYQDIMELIMQNI